LQLALDNYCQDYLYPTIVNNCTMNMSDPVSTYQVVPTVTIEGGNVWAQLKDTASGNCLTEVFGDTLKSSNCSNNHFHQTFNFQYTNNYFKVITASGKVWDIVGGSTATGALIQAFDNNDGDNQRFSISKDGTFYKFTVKNSGLCIDTVNGNTADFAPVGQYNCQLGNPNQQWTAYAADPNPIFLAKWVLVQGYNSNFCLKDNGNSNNLIVIPCDKNDNNQKWQFNFANGYKIVGSSGRVWDISGGSSDNGRALDAYSSNDQTNQRYYVYMDGGYFKIQNWGTRKCMSGQSGWVNNAPMCQWDCATGNNQQKFSFIQL